MIKPRTFGFLALLAVAAGAGLRGPPVLDGDAREYILQTQAIVFDQSLRIDPAARRMYWNATNPFGAVLGETRPPAGPLAESAQAGGGFGGLYPDRRGHYRYYHFWLYSAIVAPLYGLFHLLDPAGALEYYSFRVVNVLLLLAFLGLAWRRAAGGPALAALALLLASPLIPYCDWAHPEIFCLASVFAAFHFADRPKGRLAAPLLLGLAASLNPPILFFFPALFLLAAAAPDRPLRQTPVRFGAAFALGGGLALSSMAYFLLVFGAPSVISRVGLASLAYASPARALDLFFNPFIGAFWFFPLPFLALPAFFRRGQRLAAAVLLAGVGAAAGLCSATANFNAGQIGASRYAIWLLAPLWFALFQRLPRRFHAAPAGLAWTTALLLNVAAAVHFRTLPLLAKEIDRFRCAWRARSEVAALLRALPFAGDAEVLAENILGAELPHPGRFRDVYVWDLGHDRHLWLLPERALARGEPILLRPADPRAFSIAAAPAQPLPLQAQGDLLRLQFSREALPRLRRHPVLGGYLVLRSHGRIESLATRLPLRLRSQSIARAEPPDAPRPAEPRTPETP